MTKMWLIVVDAYSKWPEVIAMSSTTTTKTIEHLRILFARHGLPQQLVSDNRPQFISEEFALFLQSNGIKHVRTAPYHPATNGLAERFVQTFKSAMQASTSSASLNARLQNFLLLYRNTPHATTKATPAQLLMHRSLRTRLDLLRPDTRAVVQQQQQRQAGRKIFNETRQLAPGTTAMVRDYRPGHPRWIPAQVLAHTGLHYDVEVHPGVQWRRHIDQMRPAAVTSLPDQTENPSVLPPLPTPVPAAPTTAEAAIDTRKEESGKEEKNSEQHDVPEVTERRYPQRIRKSPERLIETT